MTLIVDTLSITSSEHDRDFKMRWIKTLMMTYDHDRKEIYRTVIMKLISREPMKPSEIEIIKSMVNQCCIDRLDTLEEQDMLDFLSTIPIVD